MSKRFEMSCTLAVALGVAACADEGEGAAPPPGPSLVDATSPIVVADAGFVPFAPADAGTTWVPDASVFVPDAGGWPAVIDAGGLLPSGDAGATDGGMLSGDAGARDGGAGGCGVDTYANYGQAFFMTNCTTCHGAQAATTGANLRLDSVTTIRRERAHIIEHTVDLRPPIMPLRSMGLPQAERDRLKRWLDCNAP